MKLFSFLAVGLLAAPAVLGEQCYDCKTVVKQLQAKGKKAVAACYNPKFPRKQPAQCTKTSTSWTTVTKKLTTTKTVWKTEQSTKTVTKTGPSVVKTLTITSTETIASTITLVSTDTESTTTTETNSDSSTITERSTSTVPFFVQTVVTTEYTATVPATTSIFFLSDSPAIEIKHKRDNQFDYKCSSAACHCLLGLQPKTKTVNVKKKKTKSVVVKTTTITKTSTLKPTTKYVDVAGVTGTTIGTEFSTKIDISTEVDLKTLTEISTSTEYTTELFTEYIATTVIRDATATTTTQDILTSGTATSTTVCQVNALTPPIDCWGNGWLPFRKTCGAKIPSSAFSCSSTLSEYSIEFQSGTSACNAAFNCQFGARALGHGSFFLTKLRNGKWRCIAQCGASENLPLSDYVFDPDGIETYFYTRTGHMDD
ncbi:hypothetical protein TWF481_001470 [Arthrobotrys musiformis]|uniref:Uncharacterized protein n=1 Tax=Arthrobotrys musiformis TaxID=47236 RepID=A0AAV9WQS7_9PEZI